MTRREWEPGLCMDCFDAPATHGLYCQPCAFRELEIEGPRYRVSDPFMARAEDPWYIGGNHLPAKASRPDPIKEAA